MPIYAYKCESCGHTKDVLQKMSDPELSVCPQCGAATFSKQLTAAGFQLKGSGWYVTDFRGGNSAAAAPAATDGSTASEPPAAKTEAKTDSSATPASSAASASAPSPSPAAPAASSASSASATPAASSKGAE